jgi:hypothetical protein
MYTLELISAWRQQEISTNMRHVAQGMMLPGSTPLAQQPYAPGEAAACPHAVAASQYGAWSPSPRNTAAWIETHSKSQGSLRWTPHRERCEYTPENMCVSVLPTASTHTAYTFEYHAHSKHTHTTYTFVCHAHSLHQVDVVSHEAVEYEELLPGGGTGMHKAGGVCEREVDQVRGRARAGHRAGGGGEKFTKREGGRRDTQ